MATENLAPGTPPAVIIRRLGFSYRLAHVIFATAQLGLADHLEAGPKSADDLASRLQADPRALCRFLRVLLALGVIKELAPDLFGLTPLGDCLRSGAPGSQRDAALFRAAEWFQRPWFGLLDTLRTGKPATEQVLGMSMWQYLAAHPEAGRVFNAGMSAGKAEVVPPLLAAYDFASCQCIVDVGGGRGHLLIPLLLAYLHLRGVLVDLPNVIAEARSAVEVAGVAARCDLVAGDFFEQLPSGGDTYLLGDIIHDWDDEHSVRILRRCRQAIAAAGKLLLVERIVPEQSEFARKATEDPGVLDVVLMDLMLMVAFGGQERTSEEHRALLQAAGFRLARIIPLGAAALSIIEALPV